jgi:hypothetical protein
MVDSGFPELATSLPANYLTGTPSISIIENVANEAIDYHECNALYPAGFPGEWTLSSPISWVSPVESLHTASGSFPGLVRYFLDFRFRIHRLGGSVLSSYLERAPNFDANDHGNQTSY